MRDAQMCADRSKKDIYGESRLQRFAPYELVQSTFVGVCFPFLGFTDKQLHDDSLPVCPEFVIRVN